VDDKARSLMLSPFFDLGEDVVGLSEHDLMEASSRIQSGSPYTFDPSALSSLVSVLESVKATTSRQLIGDLIRWLLPPIAVLVGICWLSSRK